LKKFKIKTQYYRYAGFLKENIFLKACHFYHKMQVLFLRINALRILFSRRSQNYAPNLRANQPRERSMRF